MLKRIANTLAIAFILGGIDNSAAQVPKLLQETADHYRALDAYEFDGVMDIRFPEIGWKVSTKVILTSPKRGSIPASSPLNGESQSYRQSSQVRIAPGEGKPLPRFGYPGAGLFSTITKRMLSAEKTGNETLQLNGQPASCEIWKISYISTDEHPHDTPITYWINPKTHLVLRESTTEKMGSKIGTALVITNFSIAKFNVRTPQSILDWAAQIAAKSDVTERTDWIGKNAPDFALRSINGATVKLSSLRGKAVILDFWAIACGPCRLEMPIVENLATEYRDRGVDIFGVSGDDADKARAWLTRNNHALTSLVDSDYTVSDLFKVGGIPSLVLIGPDGKIRDYWEGPVTEDALQTALAKAM